RRRMQRDAVERPMRAVRQELRALRPGMHTSPEKMISEPERWMPRAGRTTSDPRRALRTRGWAAAGGRSRRRRHPGAVEPNARMLRGHIALTSDEGPRGEHGRGSTTKRVVPRRNHRRCVGSLFERCINTLELVASLQAL